MSNYMTVSELYELKSKFYEELNKGSMRKRDSFDSDGWTGVEFFVDYLANWIYENEKRRS